MQLTFQVSVEVDEHWISRKAAQRAVQDHEEPTTHIPLRIRIGIEQGIENALSDAVIHKDGIVAGSVTVIRQEP